jgi:hypothetical protein
MRGVLSALAAVCALALMGCDQQAFLNKIASAQDQEEAKADISDLRARRFDEIEKRLDPSLKSEKTHAELIRMAGFFPDAEPTSETLVGARSQFNSETTLKEMTFEYAYPDNRWLVFTVGTREASGTRVLTRLQIVPESKSLAQQNAFHLSGKTPAQYGLVALSIIFPLLTVFAFVLMLMSGNLGRKWVWGLFILFGIGKVTVNWTTGEWQVSPLFLQLFSASAGATLNGPWVFSVSLPLGAILFLLRRRSLIAKATVSADQPERI